MKRCCSQLAILAALILPVVANAQSYSIDWYKMAGGGATSTNGQYSLSGTIGQQDAGGPMISAGNYALTGGFWALFALQSPGAPFLGIFLTGTNTAIVHWPSPSSGWVLLQNTNLSQTNWVSPAESVSDDGTIRYITVNPPLNKKYYRLYHP